MVTTIHQQKAKELENDFRRKYYENQKELNPWVCNVITPVYLGIWRNIMESSCQESPNGTYRKEQKQKECQQNAFGFKIPCPELCQICIYHLPYMQETEMILMIGKETTRRCDCHCTEQKISIPENGVSDILQSNMNHDSWQKLLIPIPIPRTATRLILKRFTSVPDLHIPRSRKEKMVQKQLSRIESGRMISYRFGIGCKEWSNSDYMGMEDMDFISIS